MTSEFRHPFLVLITLLLAAAGSLLVLPDAWQIYRPFWVALILFYWSLKYPHHIGMGFCWIIGLLWDVLMGTPLGVHALVLSVQTYVVLMLFQRLQMYPVLQQAFVLFIVVGIDLMIYRWMMGIFSHPATDMGFLWGALTTALCWPLLAKLLNRWTMNG